MTRDSRPSPTRGSGATLQATEATNTDGSYTNTDYRAIKKATRLSHLHCKCSCNDVKTEYLEKSVNVTLYLIETELDLTSGKCLLKFLHIF